ncbi:similar to Saccharomyces cerevisiae YDL146W LDB17 Protein involved in the regulation of endocytosis [Geotrichum candidum]|uniref:Similar to Saccharomyces cerevisiae YDL146W LDB17 Protein involved in the regulation of endocytosis n=1 Tax=Geotrichum candidum TaxID=1173061 RepID=A0A0J9XHA4_GEOCN|nr:similar to Saccharomyces cerevisiae YDL146W LDB17 Protein involved in the regulation of endocytosis [Geotrichum candidum]
MDVLFYELDNEEQFWDELSDITSRDYHSHVAVEKALLSYLHFASLFLDKYLCYDEQLSKCVKKLVHSPIFRNNKAYVRRRFASLMASELVQGNMSKKIIIGAFLLIDGRIHSWTLEMLEEEKALPSIISTIWENHDQEGPRSVILSRIFLDLLYEMCKVQKLDVSDLQQISVKFIEYLFAAIENRDDYDHDPYGYALLKVLLALNEQFMIKSYETYQAKVGISESEPDTIELQRSISLPESTTLEVVFVNKVFDTLAKHKERYPTFGENIVFLLNRSNDTCIQLMTLKFLYLIFSTAETCDYIYLNDLKVIVDVFIRELQDLPVEEERLRHTYLRVFLPLLLYTELRRDEYKRKEIISILDSMCGESSVFEISVTTRRLASRCLSVDWLNYSSTRPSHTRSISETNLTVNNTTKYHGRSASETPHTTDCLNQCRQSNYSLSPGSDTKYTVSQPTSPASSLTSITSTLTLSANNTENAGNSVRMTYSEDANNAKEIENKNVKNQSSTATSSASSNPLHLPRIPPPPLHLPRIPPPPPPSRLVHALHEFRRHRKPPPPIPTEINNLCGMPPPLPSPRKRHSQHKHNDSDLDLANFSLPPIKENTVHTCREVKDIDPLTSNSNPGSDSDEFSVSTTKNLPPLPRKRRVVPAPPPPPPNPRRITIHSL